MALRVVGTLTALASIGCASATSGGQPAVSMRFLETPETGDWKERVVERHPLNTAVIHGARLTYTKPAELVRAAEIPKGGNPKLLLRASRALSPGPKTVLLGTARQTVAGGVADLAVYQLALECAAAEPDSPGDLKDCAGYFVRVGREWPAEVYSVDRATVTVIPEVGTARGRLRLESVRWKYQVQIEGEFTASVVEVGVVGPPLIEAK